MAWTTPVTRTTGDLITAAQWNSHLGGSGNSVHVHDGVNHKRGEEVTTTGTENRDGTTASAYTALKLLVFFNGALVHPTDITEVSPAAGTFQFTSGWLTRMGISTIVQGSGDSADDDVILVDYLIAE